MEKLIWERTTPTSKDIRLLNPEDFNKEEYRRILKDFIEITGAKLGERLAHNLIRVFKSPETATLTFQADRLGYDGLNRWSK